MAPRTLHFAKKKLMWECVSKVWAEDFGLADLPPDRRGGDGARKLSLPFVWPTRPGLEQSHRRKRLDAFYRCVEELTMRNLTKTSDKVPALSGLASVFRTPDLGLYLAGLWEKDLFNGLSWYALKPWCNKKTDDGAEYIAPTWSWASTDNCCFVRDLGTSWSPQQQAEFEKFESTLKPQLLSHHIDLATSDPCGRLSAASLTLRGYIRPLHLRDCSPPGDSLQVAWDSPTPPRGAMLDREIVKDFFEGHMWMFGPPHEFIPWADFNWWNTQSTTDSFDTRPLVAFPISMSAKGLNFYLDSSLKLSMLVLEPVEGSKNTYRRIGYVEVTAPSEMDPARWEKKDFTII